MSDTDNGSNVKYSKKNKKLLEEHSHLQVPFPSFGKGREDIEQQMVDLLIALANENKNLIGHIEEVKHNRHVIEIQKTKIQNSNAKIIEDNFMNLCHEMEERFEDILGHLNHTNDIIGSILFHQSILFHEFAHSRDSLEQVDKIDIKTKKLDKEFSQHKPFLEHVSKCVKEGIQRGKNGQEIYQ